MHIHESKALYGIPSNCRRILQKIGSNNNLNPEQVNALIYTKHKGLVNQSQGAKDLGYSIAAFLNIINTLTDLGYIIKERDGKRFNYSLSAKGEYIIRGYSLLMRRAINEG